MDVSLLVANAVFYTDPLYTPLHHFRCSTLRQRAVAAAAAAAAETEAGAAAPEAACRR